MGLEFLSNNTLDRGRVSICRTVMKPDPLITNTLSAPLDTFRVVFRAGTLTPVPSNPLVSVHAVSAELKLKLPLLCANAIVAAIIRIENTVAIVLIFMKSTPGGLVSEKDWGRARGSLQIH